MSEYSDDVEEYQALESARQLLARHAERWKLKVFKLDPRAKLPERMDSAAAGYDIRCLNDFSISWDERVVVRTGLVIQPPEGYHTEIFLRSGMAFKYGIFLSNNIGLIDRNYSSATDELMVMLSRPKAHKVAEDGVFVGDYKVAEFKAGDRIAQLVIRKTEIFPVEEVFEAPSLIVRGGLGSTGQR